MVRPRKAQEFAGTVDFGVLTVREDELESMARRCRDKAMRQHIVRGRQEYLLFDAVLGKKQDLIYRLALTRSIRQGGGESQRRASNMIEDLDPNWLMLVGIAGATPSSEFTLGDVVVATELHEFSVRAAVFGKSTQYRPGGGAMAPEVEDFIGLLAARRHDLGHWNEVATIGRTSPLVDLKRPRTVYGDKDWRRKVRDAVSQHFPTAESTRKPQLTTRPFAGGNVLIKDDSLWQQWQSHARQIEAVEMELEGVYTAARTRRRTYPILVSKAISDIIGLRRDDAWTKYACETAAAGALAMLALRPVEPRDKPELAPDDPEAGFSNPSKAHSELATSTPGTIPKPIETIERYRTTSVALRPPSHNSTPRYRVVGFDLDGTLLRGYDYSWTLVWQHLGISKAVWKPPFARYLASERTFGDYQVWCEEDLAQLRIAGLRRDDFSKITRHITPTRNLEQTLKQLRAAGVTLAILSGGIDIFLAEKLPKASELFDYISINKLAFDDAGVIHQIDPTPFDFAGKAEALEAICKINGVTLRDSVFVGEGYNDDAVAAKAGLAIAYPPRSTGITTSARVEITEDDLSAILEHIL